MDFSLRWSHDAPFVVDIRRFVGDNECSYGRHNHAIVTAQELLNMLRDISQFRFTIWEIQCKVKQNLVELQIKNCFVCEVFRGKVAESIEHQRYSLSQVFYQFLLLLFGSVVCGDRRGGGRDCLLYCRF